MRCLAASQHRLVGLVLPLLAAACATPEFAQFAPLPPQPQGQRVARERFSIVVPTGFALRDTADPSALSAFEEPPANGRYRAYRTLEVVPLPALAADDADALSQVALATLRQLRAADQLEEHEHGTARLGERDAFFVRGSIRGPSAGWFFDVLDYLVPGAPQSLAVRFAAPAGQLEASRAGFTAIAATLQTDLGAPRLAGGEATWLDGDRLAIRLPEDWLRQPAAEGVLAAFDCAVFAARCEIASVPGTDLAAVRRTPEALTTDDSPRQGRASARSCRVVQDQDGPIVTDETFVVAADHLDRITFRMPLAAYRQQRAAVERALASLRWR